MFKKLPQRQAVFRQILEEIERPILRGELAPGAPLPSERVLAQRLAVSRNAVREAIKVLAQKQLVAVRHGKGIVVNHPSSSSLAAPLNLLVRLGKANLAQLLEVRGMIEPEMAALAAQRASGKQLTAMREAVEALRTIVQEPKRLARRAALDLAFHRAVSDGAGNAVAKAMLDSVQQLFFESVEATASVRGSLERAISYHARILDAIEGGDSERARLVMKEHLDRIAEDLLHRYAKQEEVNPKSHKGDLPL
jgi:GntR family transcriptional regulator, transcriptional repressor for pyruvate dehydrogenase complex